MTTNDHALLEAALIGYQHQAEQIAEKIAVIRHQLSGKSTSAAPKAAAAPAKKRSMSAAARKRIAAAQKKRWAEYHKLKEDKS
jgi:serine phosphatase RsbU (regulator of sigma subunit)